MQQRTRSYIYKILTPLAALLVAYGLIDPEAADLWVALGAAVLAAEGGLAAAYTPTGRRLDDGHGSDG